MFMSANIFTICPISTKYYTFFLLLAKHASVADFSRSGCVGHDNHSIVLRKGMLITTFFEGSTANIQHHKIIRIPVFLSIGLPFLPCLL